MTKTRVADRRRELAVVQVRQRLAGPREEVSASGRVRHRQTVRRKDDGRGREPAGELAYAGAAGHYARYRPRSRGPQARPRARPDRRREPRVGRGAEWHVIAVRCLRRHLGEPRRAGSGTYGVTRRHGDYLGPAGFRLESRDYTAEHEWTADEIVGYLYSTSFAGPHVLGGRREPFERDLREALAAARADGVFRERLDFYLVIAHKARPDVGR